MEAGSASAPSVILRRKTVDIPMSATVASADRDNSCVHSPNSSPLRKRVSKGKARIEAASVPWDHIHAAIVFAYSSLRSRALRSRSVTAVRSHGATTERRHLPCPGNKNRDD